MEVIIYQISGIYFSVTVRKFNGANMWSYGLVLGLNFSHSIKQNQKSAAELPNFYRTIQGNFESILDG